MVARNVAAFILALLVTAFILHATLTSRVPIGVDFVTPWLGARAMVLEGEDPYAETVTRRSQRAIYGRDAKALEDQVAFAYPPHVALALLPSLPLPFAWASALWLAALLLLLALVVPWAFPNVPPWVGATLIFFYPVARGLMLGQIALLVGLLLLVTHALARRRDARSEVGAGATLAWLTIKPQLAWPFLLLFPLRWLGERRPRPLAALVAAGALYAALAWHWLPNWPLRWLAQSRRYLGYVEGRPLLVELVEALLPAPLAGAIVLLLVLGLGLAAIRVALSEANATRGPAWAVLLLLLLHPRPVPSEQVVVLLPLLLWIDSRRPPARLLVPAWLLLMALPWLVFVAAFDGREPGVVGWVVPLLYLLWFALTMGPERRMIGDRATQHIAVRSTPRERPPWPDGER